MKKFKVAILCIFVSFSGAFAGFSRNCEISIYKPGIPILLNRDDNVVYELLLNCKEAGDIFNSVILEFPDSRYIESAGIFYSGGTSVIRSRTRSQAIKRYFNELSGGQRIFSQPAYSIKKGEVNGVSGVMELNTDQRLVKGENYFWISIRLKKDVPLTALIRSRIREISVNNEKRDEGETSVSRVGVTVRNSGDDGVYAYRIPGLTTTKDGSLIAVYDVRNNTAYDLQEDVDVGMSRSTDGGRTWEPMKIIMDMGEWGGLPQSQNGIGDPCILTDEITGRVWCAGLWTHGMGNSRAWQTSGQGTAPEDETGQVMLVYSDNDGKTWSEPVNITAQIKDTSWRLILQGPGKGITMEDGTLVFPIQYVDSSSVPYASVICSKDRGQSWYIGAPVKSNTTESQAIEYPCGTIMLNIRDNRGGCRAVYTSSDLGGTWSEHVSSRSALPEPVCMASLIKTTYKGKPVLLFCNPNSLKSRKNITIKASMDGGVTWPVENQVLLDDEPSWGYSCLTMVCDDTVGILYEGSTSQLVFQCVKLDEILGIRLMPSADIP